MNDFVYTVQSVTGETVVATDDKALAQLAAQARADTIGIPTRLNFWTRGVITETLMVVPSVAR